MNANGCVVDAPQSGALRTMRCGGGRQTVIDLDGAWLGGNASVRVMNLAVRREN
jgi:hypothetical protein